MKQTFLKFAGKKLLTVAILSASILLTSVSAHASKHPSTIEILSDSKTDVQFAGSTDDALLFKVNVDNEKGSNFIVTIANESGDVLYSHAFSDVNFQKQFKVLKGDQDNQRYYFTISSGDKSQKATYVVTAATRTVEDVAVNKL